MISQKDAVYQATRAVLQQRDIDFQDGGNIRDVIKQDPKMRSEIRDLVFEALKSGEVGLGSDRPSNQDKRENESQMRTYATGLLSNWFRKDRRLNGGSRYTPSTSRQDRRSSRDDQISKLEAALDVATDPELKQSLQNAINDRQEELDTERELTAQVKSGKLVDKDDITSINNADVGIAYKDIVNKKVDRSKRIDQDEAPSMGSGHRGAVTDPEHDRRLKRNEDPALHQARVEAGQKGGSSRGGDDQHKEQEGEEDDENRPTNIFTTMLHRKRA